MKKTTAFAMVVLLLLSLAGCGSDVGSGHKENDLTSMVTAFCDGLKTYDYDAVSSCFASGDPNFGIPDIEQIIQEDGERMGQIAQYFKDFAGEMTYSIGSPTVTDDTAVVPVTFTFVNFGPVVSDILVEAVIQAVKTGLDGSNESEFNDLMFSVVFDKLDSLDPGTVTDQVELPCIKTGEGWKIQALDDAVLNEIQNVISGNLMTTYDRLQILTELG